MRGILRVNISGSSLSAVDLALSPLGLEVNADCFPGLVVQSLSLSAWNDIERELKRLG